MNFPIVLTALSLLLTTASSLAAYELKDDDETAALRAEVASLRAEVAQLRSALSDHWLTEQRATEIREIVHDILSDADTRASLLSSNITAVWDDGFKIGSADGNYLLRIGGRIQVLYVYNHQSNPPATDPPSAITDRHRSGFELRRTRLVFSGHVLDPSWQYHIQGDFSRSTGNFTLLMAYIDKHFDHGIMLRIGQFRSRFLAENHMSSARLLAVDRSLVDFTFGQTFTQGIELHVPVGERVRLTGAFHDGIPSTTGFMGSSMNTPWHARTTEYAFLGRAEFLLAGNWRQFREFTSWHGDEFGMMIGLAGAWQRDEHGVADASVTKVLRWTADATFKFGGANMFIAFIGNHERTNPSGVTPGMYVDQYGLVVQGGFFIIPDQWELFARYEWGDFDMVDVPDLSIFTAGVTRYFSKHALKWTTDIGYGFNPVAAQWARTSAGWRFDAIGDRGQIVVRSLLQLSF